MTKKPYNLPQMFAEMQRRYQGLVYSVIYGVSIDAVESWDLTQEVFVKAYECPDFWSEGFQQKAWLVTVARNEALKYRRSLKAGCVIWHVSVASKGQAMPASSKTA